MSNMTLHMARDMERRAAWQRINAAHADALWVWEARLLTAEHLERKATELRARLCHDNSFGSNGERARANLTPLRRRYATV